jgi:hypothetical protein
VRFQGITHLGHVITCRGTVVEIAERNGERCARVEVSNVNQYGEVTIAGEAWWPGLNRTPEDEHEETEGKVAWSPVPGAASAAPSR